MEDLNIDSSNVYGVPGGDNFIRFGQPKWYMCELHGPRLNTLGFSSDTPEGAPQEWVHFCTLCVRDLIGNSLPKLQEIKENKK